MKHSPTVLRQATLLEKLAASLAILAVMTLSVPPQVYADEADGTPTDGATQVSAPSTNPVVSSEPGSLDPLSTEGETSDSADTDQQRDQKEKPGDTDTEGSISTDLVLPHVASFITSPAPENGPTCILQSDSATTFNGAASVPVSPLHSAWTAIKHGATWIWGENPIADAQNGTTETFTKTFTLTSLPSSGTLDIAADNSYEVTLNGVQIAADSEEFNYEQHSSGNRGQDQVSIPVANLQVGVNTLTFTVHNFPQAGGTMATNPAGLLYTVTLYNTTCTTPPPPPPPITVVATKVVCDDESLLPNWGAGGHGPIDQNTASTWVSQHPGCHLQPGWQFEWADQSGPDGGDATLGHVAGYTTFGPTSAQGTATATISLLSGASSPLTELHLREVLQPGYVPFTHAAHPDNSATTSAEFYCANDVLNYDNWDFIRNPQSGQTYYCVGFNAPARPATSAVTLCKYDEQQHPLSGWRLSLTGEHVQDFSVDSHDSNGISTNPLVAGVSYVAKATGTWLNQGGANPVDAEYSTTDGWATHMDGYTGYGSGILETEINDTDGSWGPYTSAHEYLQSFVQGANGPAHFRIFDGDTNTHTQNLGWFGDNSGLINISLSKGYVGTTDSTGCVTFTDVPYGTYTVGEVSQPDWTNVSGLGEVKVGHSSETFNVVNRFTGTTPPPTILKVHIYKYLQTDAGPQLPPLEQQIPDTASGVPQFPMVSTWKTANLNGGATSTGNYVLGNGEGGAAYKYAADTSPMNAPANYETHEITGGDSPVVAGPELCSPGKYYLVGYRNGSSLASAQAAPLTATPTSYYGITTDQYQIVVNRACPSGDGNPGGGVSTTTQTIVVHGSDLASSPGDVLANPSKWLFYNDTTDAIDTTLGTFVLGPTGQPAGTGSAQVTLASSTSRVNLATYGYASTSLARITELKFSGYSHSGVAGASESPYLVMNVDFNGSNTYQRRLVYVPADNGPVPQDAWNTYDLISGGAAKWQYSGATWPATLVGPHAGMTTAGTAPRTWSEILADYPNARILPSDGHLGVRTGEPGPAGYTSNIDAFIIGITNGTTGTRTTYDFEPTTVTTTDTNGGGGGGSSSSRRRGSVLGVSTTTEPQGQVLGASCGILLPNYLKIGWPNNMTEVKDLQTFLNAELSMSLPVSGFFGKLTEAAVRAFQLKYSSDVLVPWIGVPGSGITSAKDTTGFVYKSTQWKVNMIHCPELNLPFPTLP